MEPGDGDKYHVKPHETLFGIMLIIGGGAAFFHNLSFLKLPYTVIMFAYGIIMGVIGNAIDGGKYETIFSGLEVVNPELVFYIFLPILIFEGSYGMKTHAFWSVFSFVLLLAGPGVLINTGFLLLFFKAIYPEWGWFLAALLGSILSATDPVAVVALLKDLGVDKRLTAIVDGEAIINDGTAIILFVLLVPAAEQGSFEYPWWRIILQCLQLTIGAVVLGLFLGWITRIALQVTHTNQLVQTCVTVSFAYIAFFIGDVWLKTSGVLTLCFMGVYLATFMPTLFPGREGSNINVTWHFLVHLANTCLFALVGVVIARDVFPFLNVSHIWKIFALYGVCAAARFVMIIMLKPAFYLTNDNYVIGIREACLLVHGGLRGGVATMLALVVHETEGIPEHDRAEVLIMTSGIVILTLVINATTAKPVVEWLGHKAKDQNRLLQMEIGTRHLKHAAEKSIRETKHHPFFTNTNWLKVETILNHIQNPYEGVRTIPETDDRMFNVLLMRAFKTKVWAMRDRGAIGEDAVRILATATADNIRLGTLISLEEDLADKLSYPSLLRWLCRKVLPDAGGTSHTSEGDDGGGPFLGGGKKNEKKNGAGENHRHHHHHNAVVKSVNVNDDFETIEIEEDESDVDEHGEGGQHNHGSSSDDAKNINTAEKKGGGPGLRVARSISRTFNNKMFQKRVNQNEPTVEGDGAGSSSDTNNEQKKKATEKKSKQHASGQKQRGDKKSKANNNDNKASSVENTKLGFFARLVLRWRLWNDRSFVGVLVAFDDALIQLAPMVHHYALRKEQIQRAEAWLAHEKDLINFKLKQYGIDRPKTLCALMTRTAAETVVKDVIEACEHKLQGEMGFAVPAVEALEHVCEEARNAIREWPMQIEPMETDAILFESAIIKALLIADEKRNQAKKEKAEKKKRRKDKKAKKDRNKNSNKKRKSVEENNTAQSRQYLPFNNADDPAAMTAIPIIDSDDDDDEEKEMEKKMLSKQISAKSFISKRVLEYHLSAGDNIKLHDCVGVVAMGVISPFGSGGGGGGGAAGEHGRKRQSGDLGPGDCFNVAPCIANTSPIEFIVTSKEATILSIPYHVVRQLFSSSSSSSSSATTVLSTGNNSSTTTADEEEEEDSVVCEKIFTALVRLIVPEALAPGAHRYMIGCGKVLLDELIDEMVGKGKVVLAPTDGFKWIAGEVGCGVEDEFCDTDAMFIRMEEEEEAEEGGEGEQISPAVEEEELVNQPEEANSPATTKIRFTLPPTSVSDTAARAKRKTLEAAPNDKDNNNNNNRRSNSLNAKTTAAARNNNHPLTPDTTQPAAAVTTAVAAFLAHATPQKSKSGRLSRGNSSPNLRTLSLNNLSAAAGRMLLRAIASPVREGCFFVCGAASNANITSHVGPFIVPVCIDLKIRWRKGTALFVFAFGRSEIRHGSSGGGGGHGDESNKNREENEKKNKEVTDGVDVVNDKKTDDNKPSEAGKGIFYEELSVVGVGELRRSKLKKRTPNPNETVESAGLQDSGVVKRVQSMDSAAAESPSRQRQQQQQQWKDASSSPLGSLPRRSKSTIEHFSHHPNETAMISVGQEGGGGGGGGGGGMATVNDNNNNSASSITPLKRPSFFKPKSKETIMVAPRRENSQLSQLSSCHSNNEPIYGDDNKDGMVRRVPSSLSRFPLIAPDQAALFHEVFVPAAAMLATRYDPSACVPVMPYLAKLQLRFLLRLEQLMAAALRYFEAMNINSSSVNHAGSSNDSRQQQRERALVVKQTEQTVAFLQVFCTESFPAERIIYTMLLAAEVEKEETEEQTNESSKSNTTTHKAEVIRQHFETHMAFTERVSVWREQMDHGDGDVHPSVIREMTVFACTHFAEDAKLCSEAQQKVASLRDIDKMAYRSALTAATAAAATTLTKTASSLSMKL